jgi:CDGSH-type Zn-finger protein
MYIEPEDQSTRDYMVLGERQIRLCDCGHTKSVHKPMDGTNGLVCGVDGCECPNFRDSK